MSILTFGLGFSGAGTGEQVTVNVQDYEVSTADELMSITVVEDITDLELLDSVEEVLLDSQVIDVETLDDTDNIETLS